MRRLALPLAALAALALPVPLQAQEPLSADAEETLKCAVWASYFSVEFEGQDESVAFAHALNYFVGRFEGLTGHGIDEALDEELLVEAASSIDEMTPVCTARMTAYGARMLDWGEALQAIANRMPNQDVSKS